MGERDKKHTNELNTWYIKRSTKQGKYGGRGGAGVYNFKGSQVCLPEKEIFEQTPKIRMSLKGSGQPGLGGGGWTRGRILEERMPPGSSLSPIVSAW